jgi:Ca2+-binding EF-hand superfamily protein
MAARLSIGLWLTIGLSLLAPAAEPSTPAPPRWREFDTDGDGVVSRAEFLARAGDDAAVWRRDFGLCDWDADGVLSPAEFAGCPAVFPPDERGPWPDPLAEILQKYIGLFDEHWERWDVNRNGELSQGEFVSGTLALSIPPLKTAAVKGIDPDGNGIVSREEARRVLELLLGIRSGNDHPLRTPNGSVVDFARFRTLDTDNDGVLSPEEIAAATFPHSTPAQTFRVLDGDRDGEVIFEEWCQAPRYSLFDPIEEFRRLDVNLDGRLDGDELQFGVASSHQPLAKYMLPAFDRDGDGVLSLAEYRCSPLGLPVLRWFRELTDANNDGQLSFEEFLHDGGQYRLLAWEMFQRLDLNQDGRLDRNEFFFYVRQPDALYELAADGSGWRRLWQPEGFPDLESVAVSPDGQHVACVRWTRRDSAMETRSELCVLDRQATTVRLLGFGRYPSWTADSHSILCQRPVTGSTNLLTTVQAHGAGENVMPLAAAPTWAKSRLPGFSLTQASVWSPDGTRLAGISVSGIWTSDSDEPPNVLLTAFPPHGLFTSFDLYAAWSPDSRWLCLRGTRKDKTQQIVTVHVGGPELGFRVHDTCRQSDGGLTWHPRGDRIVFSKFCPERNRKQLYEFDPQRPDPPRLVAGQDPNRNNTDPCWTPDGGTLLLISGDY